MKHTSFFFFALLINAVALSGCSNGNVKESLGLVKEAPDEFRVVARPPLSVPREFFLYPPDEAEAHSAQPDKKNEARQLLYGNTTSNKEDYLTHYQQSSDPHTALPDTAVESVKAGELASSAEESLLGKLEATKRQPNIRELLNEDIKAEKEKDASLLEKIKSPIKASEPIIDPTKERERITQNKVKNRPINEGKVPTTVEKNSILDSIF
jgi:hypothetical protein